MQYFSNYEDELLHHPQESVPQKACGSLSIFLSPIQAPVRGSHHTTPAFPVVPGLPLFLYLLLNSNPPRKDSCC